MTIRTGAPRVPLAPSYNPPAVAAAIRAAVAADTVADRWMAARQHVQAVGFFHRRERGTN